MNKSRAGLFEAGEWIVGYKGPARYEKDNVNILLSGLVGSILLLEDIPCPIVGKGPEPLLSRTPAWQAEIVGNELFNVCQAPTRHHGGGPSSGSGAASGGGASGGGSSRGSTTSGGNSSRGSSSGG